MSLWHQNSPLVGPCDQNCHCPGNARDHKSQQPTDPSALYLLRVGLLLAFQLASGTVKSSTHAQAKQRIPSMAFASQPAWDNGKICLPTRPPHRPHLEGESLSSAASSAD